jgi:hypothetical protein
MADHVDTIVGLGGGDGALSVRHRQGDRLFDQNVLAGFDSLDGEFRMELRRQRHHDRIDVGAPKSSSGSIASTSWSLAKPSARARLASDTACKAPSAFRVRI